MRRTALREKLWRVIRVRHAAHRWDRLQGLLSKLTRITATLGRMDAYHGYNLSGERKRERVAEYSRVDSLIDRLEAAIEQEVSAVTQEWLRVELAHRQEQDARALGKRPSSSRARAA